MAFELWPPSTPPMVLRRIDNIMSSPSSRSPLVKKQVDIKEMFKGLPAEERLKKIQEYQMAKNRSILTAMENKRARRSLRSSDVASIKSYHDSSEGILGCKHYQTNLRLAAPCCGEFYTCRFCHDDRQDHAIDRKSVNRLLCMRCGNEQSFRNDRTLDSQCSGCMEPFARYFCSVCRFYDDDPNKEIFHCDDCGVCRVGRADQFFHCKGCDACISIDLKNKHKCLQSSLSSNCPICANGLCNSVQPTSILPCGHVMHSGCLERYRKTSYKCPTCMKSLGDAQSYFDEIDRIMKTSQMPAKYMHMRASISCADCEKRSVVPYHFMYHKCGHCGSYNTNVLEQSRT